MSELLSAEELKSLVRQALREELSAAGLRLDDADHQDEAKLDFQFVRKWRKAYEGGTAKVGAAVILTVVSGALLLLWQALQLVLGRGNG